MVIKSIVLLAWEEPSLIQLSFFYISMFSTHVKRSHVIYEPSSSSDFITHIIIMKEL